MDQLKIKNFNDNVEFLHEQILASGDSISHSFLKHELIQMELLGVMSKHNAFKQLGDLQMQGGTALRLLHGSPRLSGDIDLCFSPDSDPNDYQMRDAEYLLELLQDEFTARYGMNVTLSKAKARHLIKPADDIFVDVYMFNVDTASNPSERKTKLKLEIAGIKAQTKESRGIQGNWSILPTSYQNMQVPVETLYEILADKLKALPSAWDLEQRILFENDPQQHNDANFRSRDIWDINFILEQGVTCTDKVLDLVEQKVKDYQIADSIIQKLNDMIENIDNMADLKLPSNLQNTLSARTVDTRITNKKYCDLVPPVKELLIMVRNNLQKKNYLNLG